MRFKWSKGSHNHRRSKEWALDAGQYILALSRDLVMIRDGWKTYSTSWPVGHAKEPHGRRLPVFLCVINEIPSYRLVVYNLGPCVRNITQQNCGNKCLKYDGGHLKSCELVSIFFFGSVLYCRLRGMFVSSLIFSRQRKTTAGQPDGPPKMQSQPIFLFSCNHNIKRVLLYFSFDFPWPEKVVIAWLYPKSIYSSFLFNSFPCLLFHFSWRGK